MVDCIFCLLTFHETPFTDVFCSIPLQEEIWFINFMEDFGLFSSPHNGISIHFLLKVHVFFSNPKLLLRRAILAIQKCRILLFRRAFENEVNTFSS